MMRRLKSKNLTRSYPRQSYEDDPVGNFEIRHGGTRCGEHNKIALADLVAIFTEEACKTCKNRQIARLIALKSLQEYVKRNTDNIKIVL